ncbi:MAG: hypothetical protein JSR76_07680 [Verrucomicrobia bacterium]|nr:hypothetical protein [Verrucomicrobiota bacterium]
MFLEPLIGLDFPSKETKASFLETSPLSTFPPVEEGSPAPGKRVRVYLQDFPGIYYIVFLPYNFTEYKTWPVICEIPAHAMSDYRTWLGYGITGGVDYIWVSLPILNSEGSEILMSYLPEKINPTIECWEAVLKDLSIRFHINKQKIIIAGFSLGAFATSYLGNFNDAISLKWRAYIAHSHFDGCCLNVTNSKDIDKRLERIGEKKVLLIAGKNDLANLCTKQAFKKLRLKGVKVTFIEIPDVQPSEEWPSETHNPLWILKPSIYLEKVRKWLKTI